jgi:hypothetical protein
MEDGEMKKRTMAVVMLTVMALVGLSAVAQAEWCTVTVSQVGSTGAAYFIKATDTTTPTPKFTDITFVIYENGRQKEEFATALTAFANSTYVSMYVDGYTDYSLVYGVLATK